MTKIILNLIVYFLPIFAFAQTTQEIEEAYPNKEVVRLISYNIWNGFNFSKDTNRMKRCAKWIKEKDPEIVALQELCNFDEKKLLQFAKMYGHSYAQIQKENGYPVGITSKHPIKKIYAQTKSMQHGFMHVRTYGLDLIVLHLTPFNYKKRLKEARIITDYIKSNQLDTCIVMGDFNSHSPFDAAELERHTEFVRALGVYSEKYKQNTNIRDNLLDYAVQANFIASPLEDIIRLFVPLKRRMTYPAFTFSKIYKGKKQLQQTGERIDFIYTTPSLTNFCIDAKVWNHDKTRTLSDHYPIGIDMLLKKKISN